MQPNGWAIVNLDTNFYATANQQVVGGILLGREASVRFTPVGFHWDYGDGTHTDTPTAGNTWDLLRLHEFDPTPSSHRYPGRGRLTVTSTVAFAAEYRFDGGDWIPIDGVVTVASNPLTVIVGKIKSVLVAHDCIVDPTGPGC